jgi:hypothetical protein
MGARAPFVIQSVVTAVLIPLAFACLEYCVAFGFLPGLNSARDLIRRHPGFLIDLASTNMALDLPGCS